jgi:hypothetical protein
MSLKHRLKRRWSAATLPETADDDGATVVDLVPDQPTQEVPDTA